MNHLDAIVMAEDTGFSVEEFLCEFTVGLVLCLNFSFFCEFLFVSLFEMIICNCTCKESCVRPLL